MEILENLYQFNWSNKYLEYLKLRKNGLKKQAQSMLRIEIILYEE